MRWVLCHPRGCQSCGSWPRFRPGCLACVAGQLCFQRYHCHHFSRVQSSLGGSLSVAYFPFMADSFMCLMSLPPGGWETEAQHHAVPGIDIVFGLRCCVDPPGPQVGDTRALQPNSPVLAGETRPPLPGKGMGHPKITQTHFPSLPFGKAMPAHSPMHGLLWPCCPCSLPQFTVAACRADKGCAGGGHAAGLHSSV